MNATEKARNDACHAHRATLSVLTKKNVHVLTDATAPAALQFVLGKHAGLAHYAVLRARDAVDIDAQHVLAVLSADGTLAHGRLSEDRDRDGDALVVIAQGANWRSGDAHTWHPLPDARDVHASATLRGVLRAAFDRHVRPVLGGSRAGPATVATVVLCNTTRHLHGTVRCNGRAYTVTAPLVWAHHAGRHPAPAATVLADHAAQGPAPAFLLDGAARQPLVHALCAHAGMVVDPTVFDSWRHAVMDAHGRVAVGGGVLPARERNNAPISLTHGRAATGVHYTHVDAATLAPCDSSTSASPVAWRAGAAVFALETASSTASRADAVAAIAKVVLPHGTPAAHAVLDATAHSATVAVQGETARSVLAHRWARWGWPAPHADNARHHGTVTALTLTVDWDACTLTIAPADETGAPWLVLPVQFLWAKSSA